LADFVEKLGQLGEVHPNGAPFGSGYRVIDHLCNEIAVGEPDAVGVLQQQP